MITGWPHVLFSWSASTRASASAGPPAGNGSTSRTGRFGELCAKPSVCAANARRTSASSKREARFIILLRLATLWLAAGNTVVLSGKMENLLGKRRRHEVLGRMMARGNVDDLERGNPLFQRLLLRLDRERRVLRIEAERRGLDAVEIGRGVDARCDARHSDQHLHRRLAHFVRVPREQAGIGPVGKTCRGVCGFRPSPRP